MASPLRPEQRSAAARRCIACLKPFSPPAPGSSAVGQQGLNVVAVEPFEAVATRLQLSSQLRFAVEQANTYLRDCGEQWTTRVNPELEA
jgi:hypothetical protein